MDGSREQKRQPNSNKLTLQAAASTPKELSAKMEARVCTPDARLKRLADDRLRHFALR